MSRFAVPAFFFASGFLYFRPTAMPPALLGQRLTRLILPYLVASLDTAHSAVSLSHWHVWDSSCLWVTRPASTTSCRRLPPPVCWRLACRDAGGCSCRW
ncbi:MAG: acyltransferase family protein [Deltaproteobacteria bacterium]|nr:acyltransferase family protein [Deltaproteobacteria bacterium]